MRRLFPAFLFFSLAACGGDAAETRGRGGQLPSVTVVAAMLTRVMDRIAAMGTARANAQAVLRRLDAPLQGAAE